jgi:NAD dependent epimerase/dehydratase
MSWEGKKVLVTGAGGFIGSHLTERLAASGAKTRAFVHYNSRGTRGWLDDCRLTADVEVIPGDIADRDRVRQAMAGIEVVFHLAALIGIPYSYHAPASYVQTNITGTLNVLQCARDAGVARLVHTSTSEVYGTARYTPMDENHPLCGQSPYAASKIGADMMAEAFHRSFGLPVVTVRPFNTYGPRQSARAVIPTIIGQLLVGDTVELGNIDPVRDLNYVSDTVDGFVRAGETQEIPGRVVNLGTGRGTSISALVLLIGGLMGRSPKVQSSQERVRVPEGEVDRLLADATLARELLGWEPHVPLEEGLRLTIEWTKVNRTGLVPDEYTI